MASKILERLQQPSPFILDGAMGTELFLRGVSPGACNDNLNLESPQVVASVHQAYAEAGGDAVTTNTFGANSFALARHNLADRAEAVNTAAVELARQAVGPDRCVLGDMGPCGDFLQPLGTVKPDDLKAAFIEQARALARAGVDALIIETMTAADEIEIAISAAKEAADCPVFASMSFDAAGDDFRTMMGLDIETAVSTMISAGADVVGFNCGTATLDQYVELARRLAAAVAGKAPVFAQPNAGKPELIDGSAVYNVTPEQFADAIAQIWDLGVKITGGCCGTTPAHINAVARRRTD